MKIFFVNPPYKAEYGKFSRESRSPAVTKSGALYYPLWLIYAAAYCEKKGFEIEFLDAPAKPMDEAESMDYIKAYGRECRLFVLDTSTPSISCDISFGEKLKKVYPEAFVLLVGTHPSSTAEETLMNGALIDGVARKEYDYTVYYLAKALETGADLSSVKGISYRKNGEIVHNPDAEYIEDLYNSLCGGIYL